MLIIPTTGFAQSITQHRIRLEVFCDWIEASILFADEELSKTDIVDILIEEQRYQEEDFARQGVDNAWAELLQRKQWIENGCAFAINSSRILRQACWKELPAYAFCILLSLAPYYDWWTREFGHDYTEQGELFELLTKESIETQYSGWELYHTGWTRGNTVSLKQVVTDVAGRLGEIQGKVELWDHENAKEKGLDLLMYRPFPDNRVGIPVYLVQCASGANWKSKLPTPDLNIWRSVVQFTTMPKRAFATPFSFMGKEFAQNCTIVDGLVLDRCRLLNASRHNETWVSASLQERMIAWIEPRAQTLLRKSEYNL